MQANTQKSGSSQSVLNISFSGLSQESGCKKLYFSPIYFSAVLVVQEKSCLCFPAAFPCAILYPPSWGSQPIFHQQGWLPGVRVTKKGLTLHEPQMWWFDCSTSWLLGESNPGASRAERDLLLPTRFPEEPLLLHSHTVQWQISIWREFLYTDVVRALQSKILACSLNQRLTRVLVTLLPHPAVFHTGHVLPSETMLFSPWPTKKSAPVAVPKHVSLVWHVYIVLGQGT